MFPGIAGISFLMAVGLRAWAPQRYRPGLTLGIAVTLLTVAAVLPFVSIRPAYAQPEPLTRSDIPDSARMDPAAVGAVARVVGLALDPQSIAPEDKNAFVDVVVYWQALDPDERDYVSFARLLGRDYELVGHINRHPACGMVPTSLWDTGEIWRDPYRIPVAADAKAPSRLRIEVGLYDPAAGQTLGATRVGEAKLAPPVSRPDIAERLNVEFLDGVTLLGYDLSPAEPVAGEALTVTLHWEARAAPSADYQVFVHLLGEESEPLAQGDGPPLAGDYPTSLWATGETISDPHLVVVPADLRAGDYRLLVGMYSLETMERLPHAAGGEGGAEIGLTIQDK